MSDRKSLQDRLGHTFNQPSLLDVALTHRSAVSHSTSADVPANERLEFLGDRVLGLALASLLLETFPEEAEGQLARRFAVLASAKSLARVGGDVDLAPWITTGLDVKVTDAVIADACEALIGAVYLDAGFDKARDVVVRHWRPVMEASADPPKDAKTALQEWAQGRGLPLPKYQLIKRAGPDHSPEFTLSVTVQGFDPVTGTGASKRIATQNAAQALLEMLE